MENARKYSKENYIRRQFSRPADSFLLDLSSKSQKEADREKRDINAYRKLIEQGATPNEIFEANARGT